MERKVFLKNSFGLLGISSLLVQSCKKDDLTSDTDTSTGGTGSSDGNCVASPTEVEGPYPYPAGEINNPLNRSDITGGQTGMPLSLTFTVVNVNDSCAVVADARVDIWHCNKDGYYSGYGSQNSILGTKSYIGEIWLRGYQVTGADGTAKFTTIYPGWYQGRATHIHMEVFVNNALKKTAQITFPETISDAVHVTSLYAAHGVNTIRNASDNIFNNSATDLANETVALTGNTTSGYAGSYTIGIAI
jgi:protocatechuate 3,4-dioxygenase beta subunit